MRYRDRRVYRHSYILAMLEEKFIRKTSKTRSKDSYYSNINNNSRR